MCLHKPSIAWYSVGVRKRLIGCVVDVYGFDLMTSLAYNAGEI